MSLYIDEVFTNATENYIFGDSGGVIETYCDTRGELYRSCQSEYGRCMGKIYIDTSNGTIPVGWTFLRRMQYEDSKDTYLREVWVTVHEKPPTETTEFHYA